jgi:hypothetical protein
MRQRSAALVILSALGAASCGSGDLSGIPGELGHQELRPPTTLTPPGTVIVIRRHAPIEVAVVCTQDEVVKSGGGVVKSATKTVKFAEKTAGSFALGVDYLGSVGIDARASHVKSASMTLSNAEVWEIPDSAIAASLSTIGADCRKAIDVRLGHHRTVALVKSVLRADVVYTVNFDDTVDASVKATLMTGLAAKLGGRVSSTRSWQVEGERLFWGLVTDTDFFPLAGLSTAPPVLVPGGAPIMRVEGKGDDARDYR